MQYPPEAHARAHTAVEFSPPSTRPPPVGHLGERALFPSHCSLRDQLTTDRLIERPRRDVLPRHPQRERGQTAITQIRHHRVHQTRPKSLPLVGLQHIHRGNLAIVARLAKSLIPLFAAGAEGHDRPRPVRDIRGREVVAPAGQYTLPRLRPRIGCQRIEHLFRHQADVGLAPSRLVYVRKRGGVGPDGAPNSIFRSSHDDAILSRNTLERIDHKSRRVSKSVSRRTAQAWTNPSDRRQNHPRTSIPHESPVIEFFFDCSSPWTYLAFHNIQPLAEECGEAIVWRPILVGGVFNAVNQAVYQNRANPVPRKAGYMLKDLQDWARLARLRIKMPPTVFPVNSVKAMRACIVLEPHGLLPKFARACFEAYFGDDRDISKDDVLAPILERIGVDSAEILASIARQAVKDQLIANTEELMRRGGFGSPTIFVDGADMYFGNDRLPLVREALRRHTA